MPEEAEGIDIDELTHQINNRALKQKILSCIVTIVSQDPTDPKGKLVEVLYDIAADGTSAQHVAVTILIHALFNTLQDAGFSKNEVEKIGDFLRKAIPAKRLINATIPTH